MTQRPTGVTIVAWAWIANGTLMLLAFVIGLLFLAGSSVMSANLNGSPGLPAGAGELGAAPGVTGWLTTLAQLPVGIVSIVAGAYFLALRAWARTTLEILSWLALVWTLYFSVHLARVFAQLDPSMVIPPSEIPPGMDMESLLRTAGMITGGALVVLLGIPLAIIIWYLRTEKVRGAIRETASD